MLFSWEIVKNQVEIICFSKKIRTVLMEGNNIIFKQFILRTINLEENNKHLRPLTIRTIHRRSNPDTYKLLQLIKKEKNFKAGKRQNPAKIRNLTASKVRATLFLLICPRAELLVDHGINLLRHHQHFCPAWGGSTARLSGAQFSDQGLNRDFTTSSESTES